MRIIKAQKIAQSICELCVKSNLELPKDVQAALKTARAKETSPLAIDTMDKIILNFACAVERGLPICQDTGTICVFADIGQSVCIEGDFNEAVNEGVRQSYAKGFMRASMVSDPLSRLNTGDNTPAMINISLVSGDRLKITVMPKGCGSENCSRITMLPPAAGTGGVADFVVRTVLEAGPNACPPMIVGVGLGGTFDKAALLAKKALLRPLDQPNAVPFYRALEDELLEKINALGIGPQGYGGVTTALGVSIEALPTHIAGLPCAVNIGCHVTRRASIELL